MVDISAAEAHLEQLDENKQALCAEQEAACQDLREEQSALEHSLEQCRQEALELQRQLRAKQDAAAGIQARINEFDKQCEERSTPMQNKITEIETERAAKLTQIELLQEKQQQINLEREVWYNSLWCWGVSCCCDAARVARGRPRGRACISRELPPRRAPRSTRGGQRVEG